MPIRFACPVCNAVMKAPSAKVGKKGNCPKCGQRLEIPSAQSTVLAIPLPPKPDRSPPATDASGPPPIPVDETNVKPPPLPTVNPVEQSEVGKRRQNQGDRSCRTGRRAGPSYGIHICLMVLIAIPVFPFWECSSAANTLARHEARQQGWIDPRLLQPGRAAQVLNRIRLEELVVEKVLHPDGLSRQTYDVLAVISGVALFLLSCIATVYALLRVHTAQIEITILTIVFSLGGLFALALTLFCFWMS